MRKRTMRKLTMWKLAILFSLLANLAWAQSYPSYESTTVNDYADLLSGAQEAQLSQRLDQLRSETGVEMTVLTLDSQDPFAPGQTLEGFAAGIFNDWGIGDAERNDGVLVLVLRQDRQMRIELGAGYRRDWDTVARRVVDDHFLPAFRNNDYPRGILEGSEAVIDQIVLPFHDGSPAPTGGGGDWITSLMIAGAVAVAMFGVLRDHWDNLTTRLRPCPKCGRRGLSLTRRVIAPATTAHSGQGMRRVQCPHCDYDEDTPYVIARHSRRRLRGSGGGFGGGRSGGGGASGRW